MGKYRITFFLPDSTRLFFNTDGCDIDGNMISFVTVPDCRNVCLVGSFMVEEVI